jgi:hypothetical protein
MEGPIGAYGSSANQTQRWEGTRSISQPWEDDGRIQISVVRTDGKGRHYAVARSATEANQKLAGLLTIEGSSVGLHEWAIATWSFGRQLARTRPNDAGSSSSSS